MTCKYGIYTDAMRGEMQALPLFTLVPAAVAAFRRASAMTFGGHHGISATISPARLLRVGRVSHLLRVFVDATFKAVALTSATSAITRIMSESTCDYAV